MSASAEAILIAGANGSGKTTFARQVLPLRHEGAAFINADEIRREGAPFDNSVAAAKEFLRRLNAAEVAEQAFAVETTLASRSYLLRLRTWKVRGFRTVLHFIEVPSADFAVTRVEQRVAAGGHGIPEQDIRRRFERGRRLFREVYKESVHEWHHWQSDTAGLRLVSTHRNE